jgi:hypothetical protein
MITLTAGICIGIAIDRFYPTPVSFVIAKVKGFFVKFSRANAEDESDQKY